MAAKESWADLHKDLFIYMLMWSKTCSVRQPPYSEVRAKVKVMLDEQLDRVTRDGLNPENYKQTRFAVCAWIDELVMNSAWEHHDEWQKELLQAEYYRTTNAGEEFFERLSRLHPEQKEVREIYHLCLCLGFKGRYCWDDDAPKLKEIMHQNYALLPGPLVEVRDLGLERLIPSAYPGQDIEMSPKTKGSSMSRMKVALLALIPPAFFLLLYIIYRYVLGTTLDNIMT